jgi:hypothetical protein
MIESLASRSRSFLTMQGYGGLSDGERRSLWLGLRFAPALCLAGIALGTALALPALLLAMTVVAGVGGFVTAKHPFDYVYDAAVRPLLGGPRVPPSPAPRRFACQLATPWLAAIAVAFLADAAALAWVLAVPLLLAAATVTATNWCLSSFIYGLLHRRQAGEATI